MPVSNSTKPSPRATAQALQWGTPGHGSGRRRRKRPGSTRSPRTSRARLAPARATSGMRAETRLRPLQRRKGDGMAERESCQRGEHEGAGGRRQRAAGAQPRANASPGSKAEAVARRYFAAIDARDLEQRRRAVGGGRARERARPGRRARAGGRARVHRRADRRDPRPRACRSSRRPPRASAAACSGA